MAFWDNIRFPYFNFQELNLDWILTEMKRLVGFMPDDGTAGDFLMRTADGAAWEPITVTTVDINGLPEDTDIATNDYLIFYDSSVQANRKIKPPDMLDDMMSNAIPNMDGTGSAGTSKKPARYDHRHPSDTSKQDALSAAQLAACNSGAPAGCFTAEVLGTVNGGTGQSNSTPLPLTYTTQSRITEANFNTITARKWGKMFGIFFNTVFTSAPSGSFEEVGSIDLGSNQIPSAIYSVFDTLSGSGKLSLQISTAGKISINSDGNINNTRIRGFVIGFFI